MQYFWTNFCTLTILTRSWVIYILNSITHDLVKIVRVRKIVQNSKQPSGCKHINWSKIIHNWHLQDFLSLGNLDTPHYTHEIWKYLFRANSGIWNHIPLGLRPRGIWFHIPLLPSKNIFISHLWRVRYLLLTNY